MSPPEIAANVTMTVSIFHAGRNSVHTWWTGIVACALFGSVFFTSQLYADVTLQLFFVITSALGWWQWLHGKRGTILDLSRVPRTTLGWMIGAGVAATLGYGALLHAFTNAYAPFADSAVLAFSVIAQLLLMQRRLETWPFWLLVNSIAVPLYASRGLYLTCALYAAYWLNAVVAWRSWHRRLVIA